MDENCKFNDSSNFGACTHPNNWLRDSQPNFAPKLTNNLPYSAECQLDLYKLSPFYTKQMQIWPNFQLFGFCIYPIVILSGIWSFLLTVFLDNNWLSCVSVT